MRTLAPAPARADAVLIFVAGIAGMVAAFTLAIEEYRTLKNPFYRASCSINEVLSCGTVMKSHQATTFGFPNMYLGLVGFAVVITVAVLALLRIELPQWFWWGFLAGCIFGVGFVHYLFFQSVYRINALCPYCMVVWAGMIPLFVIVASHVLRQLDIPAVTAAIYWRWTIALIWLVVIFGLVTIKFA